MEPIVITLAPGEMAKVVVTENMGPPKFPDMDERRYMAVDTKRPGPKRKAWQTPYGPQR